MTATTRRTAHTSRSFAFTLVELLVIIVIIGVLAALAVPRFTTILTESRDETAAAELETTARAALALATLRGNEPPTAADYADVLNSNSATTTPVADHPTWTAVVDAGATFPTDTPPTGELHVVTAGSVSFAVSAVEHRGAPSVGVAVVEGNSAAAAVTDIDAGTDWGVLADEVFAGAAAGASGDETSAPQADFYLDANGVTVVCDAAEFGDSGEVGGATYTKRTRGELLADSSLAETACTSGITDMSYLGWGFYGTSANPDISAWDTSNVTNMSNMFEWSDFNGDVSAWDTSNVTNMSHMFTGSLFNGDVSDWDTGSVTDMQLLFYDTPFDGDISDWDTASVTNMRGILGRAAFDGDISGWDTGNVTDMSDMFKYSPFNGDISGWCVTNITSEPSGFTGLTEAHKPVWGACPP